MGYSSHARTTFSSSVENNVIQTATFHANQPIVILTLSVAEGEEPLYFAFAFAFAVAAACAFAFAFAFALHLLSLYKFLPSS
jgi:hypothetical protein